MSEYFLRSNLPSRAVTALKKAGYDTLDKVLHLIQDDEDKIYEITGIGKKYGTEILDLLRHIICNHIQHLVLDPNTHTVTCTKCGKKFSVLLEDPNK